ncbi:MAG: hypothetical protein JXR96_14665 [Deltaproteobacteria bacterium]|nr:hypothetical protein [Deltaproteobacteria bacterium]
MKAEEKRRMPYKKPRLESKVIRMIMHTYSTTVSSIGRYGPFRESPRREP